MKRLLNAPAYLWWFLFARLVVILSQSMQGLIGYGDLINFYHLAAIPGWPFVHYWVEFPPIFSFLNKLIYLGVDGKENPFVYVLVAIFTAADVFSLVFFSRLAQKLWPRPSAEKRIFIFAFILAILPYAWWYFDSLAVMCMLAGLSAIFEEKDTKAGVWLGTGILVKLFPGLALTVLWRKYEPKRIARVAALSLGISAVVFAAIWFGLPQFGRASLVSQSSKGSWETVWALIDGNYQTGNFGPLIERLDSSKAEVARGNPARIPSWGILFVLAGIGIWGVFQFKPKQAVQSMAVLGWTMCLFFIWSPGWSPQWLLYLLPVLLLCLPERLAIQFGAIFILVNLMEWPVLLSRSMTNLLWVPILLRTVLLVILSTQFFAIARGDERQEVAVKLP